MIGLKLVKISDPRYQDIRDRHYIPNRGQIGQQLHYLIYDNDELVGIIAGAGATFSVKSRNDFFGLDEDPQIRGKQLNGIVNNTVFRIEKTRPNLATQVLARWRKQVAKDWEELYNVKVVGFETFVIEERREGMSDRTGNLYLADNWTRVGVTKGFSPTRIHGQGLDGKRERQKSDPKIILCKRVMVGKRKKRRPLELPLEYNSSWRDKTKHIEVQKKRANFLNTKRAEEFVTF